MRFGAVREYDSMRCFSNCTLEFLGRIPLSAGKARYVLILRGPAS